MFWYLYMYVIGKLEAIEELGVWIRRLLLTSPHTLDIAFYLGMETQHKVP